MKFSTLPAAIPAISAIPSVEDRENSRNSQNSREVLPVSGLENSRNSQNSSVPTPETARSNSRNSQNSRDALPVWIIGFPSGKQYQVEFDPPIRQQEVLTRLSAHYPEGLTCTAPPDRKASMLAAMGIQQYRQREPAIPAIPAIPETQELGSTPAIPAIPAIPTVPTPENSRNSQNSSAPTPEFALSMQTAPVGPPPARVLLDRWGYRVHYLREPEAARRAIAELTNAGHKLIGLDVETTPLPAYRLDAKAGLDPYKASIRTVQLAAGQTVLVLDLQQVPAEHLQPVMAVPLIAHNAVFEWRFLHRLGLTPAKLHDSLLLSRLATGQGLSLADCAREQWDIEIDKTLQRSDWSRDLSADQIAYAALDAVLALELWDAYGPAIKASGQAAAYRRMAQAVPAVAGHMLTGIPFDATTHQAWLARWTADMLPLREQLEHDLQINPDSGQQLGAWLAKHLTAEELKAWPRTASGQLKTDEAAFDGCTLPALAPLSQYKRLAKKISTYGTGYAAHIHPVTGRIHADFALAGTRGGRFRCRNPNLQNPPAGDFRRLFKAPDGYRLVVADYSQVELRIAAVLAEDPAMLDAYAMGADLHKRTAAAVAGIPEAEVTKSQRQLAKACNFGLIYGMGAAGLAAYASSSYGVAMPLEAAVKARRAFFSAYPGIARWHARTKVKGATDPTVRTRGGLIRDLGKETYGWKLTEALNTPVQGTGAEILLAALARIPAALAGLDARLVHHVHDEILLEVAERDTEAAKIALTESMVAGWRDLFPDHPMPGLVDAHEGKDWLAAKG